MSDNPPVAVLTRPLQWGEPPVGGGDFLFPAGTVTLLLAEVEGSARGWQADPEGMGRALGRVHYQNANDWAGLTPSYRIRIRIVCAHQATMYFECDYVDKTTLQVKAQIGANTTEVRRHGKWLFKSFSGGPPPKL